MKLQYMIDMDKESVWRPVSAERGAKACLPYVQELGDFMAHGKYYTTREGLPSYLIKITLSGEGFLEYEGQSCRLPVGHFFWIDCRKPQTYRTFSPDGSWRVLWVHFHGVGCAYAYERFLAAGGGRSDGVLPPDGVAAEAVRALLDLYAGETRGLEADVRAAALLSTAMSECIAAASRKFDSASSAAVREARDYLVLHFAEPVTLDDLAKRLSLSKYHLQKLFKRQMGRTPYEYLTDLRLDRAKELLRATDQPVGRVAEDVGLDNVSYFIKRFRIQEGVTPAIYRKRWQAG